MPARPARTVDGLRPFFTLTKAVVWADGALTERVWARPGLIRAVGADRACDATGDTNRIMTAASAASAGNRRDMGSSSAGLVSERRCPPSSLHYVQLSAPCRGFWHARGRLTATGVPRRF